VQRLNLTILVLVSFLASAENVRADIVSIVGGPSYSDTQDADNLGSYSTSAPGYFSNNFSSGNGLFGSAVSNNLAPTITSSPESFTLNLAQQTSTFAENSNGVGNVISVDSYTTVRYDFAVNQPSLVTLTFQPSFDATTGGIQALSNNFTAQGSAQAYDYFSSTLGGQFLEVEAIGYSVQNPNGVSNSFSVSASSESSPNTPGDSVSAIFEPGTTYYLSVSVSSNSELNEAQGYYTSDLMGPSELQITPLPEPTCLSLAGMAVLCFGSLHIFRRITALRLHSR
jgi:hypothetical protein